MRSKAARAVAVQVFHGTRSAALIIMHGFQPSQGGEFGPGIYFSENPDTAAFYALHVARGAEPPMILTTTVDVDRFYTIRKVDWIERTVKRTPRTVQNALMRQGYRGIIGIALNDYERQIVAFDASTVVGQPSIYATL